MRKRDGGRVGTRGGRCRQTAQRRPERETHQTCWWQVGLFALGLTVGLGGREALALPAPHIIVVTTLADKADPPFNADGICPGAGTIKDLPGPDGKVSLREAIIAANHTAGAKLITFAPNLAGGTIVVKFDDQDADTTPDPLPRLCGGDTAINGDLNGDGVPDITLDGSALPPGNHGLAIVSSGNTVNGLRVQNFPGIGIFVIHVVGLPDRPPTPKVVGNTITHNILRSRGAAIILQAGSGPFVGTVANTVVQKNTISATDFADGIDIVPASNSTVADTSLTGNTILNNGRLGILLVNLDSSDKDASITNTTMTNNKIVGDGGAVAGIIANVFGGRRNSITGVTIARNKIAGSRFGINAIGGFAGATEGCVEATVTDNILRDLHNPGGFTGILMEGGEESVAHNQVSAKVLRNTIVDNEGNGISIVAGNSDSSANTATVLVRGNTVKRNTGYGIFALSGWGANFTDTGISEQNVLDVQILGNVVRQHLLDGIAVIGGLGSVNGRAGAIADANQVTAKVAGNTVTQAGRFGLGLFGAFSGLADSNQLTAKVVTNQICNNGLVAIQAFGGFPGDATFPPTQGVNNVVRAGLLSNIATAIQSGDGVAGNRALVTQFGTIPCLPGPEGTWTPWVPKGVPSQGDRTDIPAASAAPQMPAE